MYLLLSEVLHHGAAVCDYFSCPLHHTPCCRTDISLFILHWHGKCCCEMLTSPWQPSTSRVAALDRKNCSFALSAAFCVLNSFSCVSWCAAYNYLHFLFWYLCVEELLYIRQISLGCSHNILSPCMVVASICHMLHKLFVAMLCHIFLCRHTINYYNKLNFFEVH